MGGWGPVIVAGLISGSALGARAQVAAPGSACRFEVVGAGKVAKVLDGRSFLLEDGREVRLAAVEVPALRGSEDTGALSPAASYTTMVLFGAPGLNVDLDSSSFHEPRFALAARHTTAPAKHSTRETAMVLAFILPPA